MYMIKHVQNRTVLKQILGTFTVATKMKGEEIKGQFPPLHLSPHVIRSDNIILCRKIKFLPGLSHFVYYDVIL